MLSGLVDCYDDRHIARINNELIDRGGSYRDVYVPCSRLGRLLEEVGLTQVHYLSIDVEGAERSILKGIDFRHIDIYCISVENNYQDSWVPCFLMAKGFIFHAIAGDEFYVNRRHVSEIPLPLA
jgi:hypothetical protein